MIILVATRHLPNPCQLYHCSRDRYVCMLSRLSCSHHILCLKVQGIRTKTQVAMQQAAARESVYAQVVSAAITIVRHRSICDAVSVWEEKFCLLLV